jgi:asparagine synthase (glutamine-hydrolysing)
MSAILGLFYRDSRPIDRALLTRMLGQMRTRGSDRSAVSTTDGAAVAVARNGWELAEGWSGEALTVMDADLVVAADASIYYQKELRDKLAAKGVRARGTTPSDLILAAYRAWGEQCTRHLEGDYAFILWDGGRRRVFCARDFGGKRPLYYADLGHAIILASTMSAVVAHPDCPDDLNLVYLAEAAGALWASPRETAYRAVSLIPAGWSLSWSGDSAARLRQHWHPPAIESGPGPAFEEAGAELRELLCRAVDERFAKTGATAVWMSGGWDSTAVFGAGAQVLQRRRGPQLLRPVSISYPPGDPGREDELIAAVAEQWHTPVHWLHIQNMPLIDRPSERAALRDEPSAHTFEIWNHSLAAGSRAVGARVAFDGNGGDQLFQVSPTFLADLLRSGRWVAFLRQWRALKLEGFNEFFRWAVKPALPPVLLDVATAIRAGKRLHGVYERWMPRWTTRHLLGTLAARQRLHTPPREARSCAAYETSFYFGSATPPRTFGVLAGLALEEGVELRSPLYDQRVIDFAVRRPRWERASGGETKHLLRRAMRGLLPDHVLAPRPFRTGMTSKYFERETRKRFPDAFRAVSESWVLAELGIVEPGLLARACQEYLQVPDPHVGSALLCTFHVESWLRARRWGSELPAEDVAAELPAPSDSIVGNSW